MRGKVGYYNILTIDHVWIFNFSHFQKEFVQHFYKMDDQQKPLHKKQNKQTNKQFQKEQFRCTLQLNKTQDN